MIINLLGQGRWKIEKLKKLGFRIVAAECLQCPIVLTSTSTKASTPLLPFVGFLQKSPYWKLLTGPIENSQGAYFQQKRKNNTGFEQTEKKEKIYPPRRNQRIEKLVSRDPVPETCFHRCNVPCRVKKCDFSNNLRIHTRNTGTKRIQEGYNSFIPPSFRTYTTPNKSGRGELTRPRYLI